MKQLLSFLISWIGYEVIGFLVIMLYAVFRKGTSPMAYVATAMGLALVYVVLACALKYLYGKLREQRPAILTSFLLGSKLGMILLSALLLLAFGLLGGGDIVLTALLLVTYYLCVLVQTSLFYVRLERKA